MTIQTATLIFDKEKAEAFAERLVGTLAEAALALMISIGHRTGLFDAMANMPDATSDALAEQAGLAERYVREWLGVVVTSQVVTYDPKARTYTLPAEHAAFLTRAAGADNADPANPELWFTGFRPLFTGYFHAASIASERIASAIVQTGMRSEPVYAIRMCSGTDPQRELP